MGGLTMEHYQVLKYLHILGAVIFVGNITITAWWKSMADRTQAPAIVAYAQRQVTLTDFVFTLSGVLLLAVTGYTMAGIAGLNLDDIQWLANGQRLFFISGLLWIFILVPVQYLQAKMAKDFSDKDTIPERYWTLGKIWMVFGIISTVLPYFTVYYMAVKPV